MAARMIVLEGTAAGRTGWIERDVTRVGSGPTCELQLPGLPPHALTLQFRDGAYYAFNRGDDPLYVDQYEVQPGQVVPWQPGQPLQIGRWAVVELELTGAGVPEAKPLDFAATPPAPAASAAIDPSARRRSERMQYTIIGLCLLATTVFLTSGANVQSTATVFDEYERLINQLQLDTPDTDLELVSLRAVLRHAFRDEMRNRRGRALNEYLHIRDRVVARQAADHTCRTELDARLLEFVQQRVTLLSN